ncbi:hypothetical protein [Brevifollis gellanilyticus]|nr:hypothetical protein [Brevifollis gellanilyticus]
MSSTSMHKVFAIFLRAALQVSGKKMPGFYSTRLPASAVELSA